jgi:hypothetical protein
VHHQQDVCAGARTRTQRSRKIAIKDEVSFSDYLPEPRVPRGGVPSVIGKDANHLLIKEE